MAQDQLFYTRLGVKVSDKLVSCTEMLDYLAKGMTGYLIPAGTSPSDEKDQPLPADEIMVEFIDRVRRIKGFCEVDGLWPPRCGVLLEPGDPEGLPRLQLTETAAVAETPGAVPLAEVQTLTRTLRHMLGLSEHPAADQSVVCQLEAILPRAIQLGEGWRLVECGHLNKCGSVSGEALLRLFGKLNTWDVPHLGRTMTRPRPRRTKAIYAHGRRLSRAFSGCHLFRYHRTDPYRPERPDKYGDWHIVEIDVD